MKPDPSILANFIPRGLRVFAFFAAWSLAPAAAEIIDLEFSSDGRYLASLDSEGTLQISDTTSLSLVLRLDNKIAGRSFAWRPGAHTLAASIAKGEGHDLWLLGLDGSERRLTFHQAKDCEPQWTEGGKALVFVSYREGNADLYRLPVRGRSILRPSVRPFVARPHNQWNPQTPAAGGGDVAYLSMEGGRPEVWIASPGREPLRVGSLGLYYRHRDAGHIAWDRSGRYLIYVERDFEKAILHAFDPKTQKNEILFEDKWIDHPRMDLERGVLFMDLPKGLARQGVKDLYGPRPTGWRRLIDIKGLTLRRPEIGVRNGKSVWAAVLEKKGVVLGDSSSRKLDFLYLDLNAHLLYAERLYAEGEKRAGESIYASLENRLTLPHEISALRIHHATQLRKNGKPREALKELDRLANAEPPVADPLRVLALQGLITLFELRDPNAALPMLRDVAEASSIPPDDIAEALAFLSPSSKPLLRSYVDAHGALRRDDPARCMTAMDAMVKIQPGSPLVQNAVFNLLNNPYDYESVEENPNPFGNGEYNDAIAANLLKLENSASASGGDASTLQHLRQELLQIQMKSRRFDEARMTAERILKDQGPEGFGLVDFLQYYLDTDRFDSPIHNLLGKVLLDPELIPALETALRDDPAALSLLSLARIKLALLEGDLAQTRSLLVAASDRIHGIPEGRFSGDVASLQRHLYVYAAKYHERMRQWDQAEEAYETALSMFEKWRPDRGDLIVSLLVASGQSALGRADKEERNSRKKASSPGPARVNPDLLWQMQVIQRGMGDPLLNSTNDPAHLRMGVNNLVKLLESSPPSELDAFLLHQIGRNLSRCGMHHCALYYLDRALNASPPDSLRIGILRERAELLGDKGNWWLQWKAYEEVQTLANSPALKDAVRLWTVQPLLQIGERRKAVGLLKRLVKSSPVETFRTIAAEELESLEEQNTDFDIGDE